MTVDSILDDFGLTPDPSGIDLSTISERVFAKTADGKSYKTISAPLGFSAAELHTVASAVYLAYSATGIVPDLNALYPTVYNNGFRRPKNELFKLLATEEFKRVMDARGVPVRGMTGLSLEQDLCLQIVLDPSDGLTLQQKLKKAGVAPSKYRAWLKQPAFREYHRRVGEGLLNDHLPDMLVQLTRNATSGDLNSIKFAMEVSGRHDPKRQQQIDLLAIMQQMMDIITRHVKDPAALQAIAGEMTAIANVTGAANAAVKEIEV